MPTQVPHKMIKALMPAMTVVRAFMAVSAASDTAAPIEGSMLLPPFFRTLPSELNGPFGLPGRAGYPALL